MTIHNCPNVHPAYSKPRNDNPNGKKRKKNMYILKTSKNIKCIKNLPVFIFFAYIQSCHSKSTYGCYILY